MLEMRYPQATQDKECELAVSALVKPNIMQQTNREYEIHIHKTQHTRASIGAPRPAWKRMEIEISVPVHFPSGKCYINVMD